MTKASTLKLFAADRTINVLTNNESEKGLTNAIAAILFEQPETPYEHVKSSESE